MSRRLRSPIPYFGRKSNSAAKFLRFFPRLDSYTTYVEPFGGGGGMLFAKEPSPVEVYNDLDSRLFEFFSVLASPREFARFRRAVEALPISRRLHEESRLRCLNARSRVDRAAAFFVAARQCFGGMLERSGWCQSVEQSQRGMASSCAKWMSVIAGLPLIHARLQQVQFECADFRRVLTNYDRPTTFFYVDPPYVPDTRVSGGYRCELQDGDHRELVKRLLCLRGRALLSGYDTQLYDPLVDAGWHKATIDVPLRCSRQRTCKRRSEVVWMNYQPDAA